MPINVMLVEDQQLMRDGIRMLLELEHDIALVAEAGDGEEAIALYKEHRPDLVLMDIEMPGLDGIAATRRIKAFDEQARILILTTFGKEEYLRNALLAGAQGFLLKAVSSQELVDSIVKVHSGTPALDGQSIAVLLGSYRTMSQVNTGSCSRLLLSREEEILRLIAGQLSNRDISSRLQLAEGTVKNYISQILDKLRVSNRNEAVQAARQLGLIE